MNSEPPGTENVPHQPQDLRLIHTVAVVAKCPIPGKCKTRLIPLLGEEGSSKLARAMLKDVLESLDQYVSFCKRILKIET
jgi:glycosyltransferase A (GT-A) superfamily protein (DUF2064 family)